MIVSVHHDVWKFGDTLDRLGKQQLPFAAALALNQTARLAQQTLTRALPDIFHKKGAPTPFTLRAIGTSAARKHDLRAAVFVKRQQARYLAIEETGGVRTAAIGAPVLAPVDIARNVYGNIPRGLLRRLAQDPESYFLGAIRGVYGLWERTTLPGQGGHVLRAPRGVRLLVAFRARAVYRPRFGFHDHVRSSVQANFLPNLAAGLERAIATAIRR